MSTPRFLRGYSILEVLVASVLFATTMLSMASVWVTHAKAIDKSQEQQVAGALAQRLMEMQRALGYQTVPVASTPFTIERTMRGITTSSTFIYEIYVVDRADPAHPSSVPHGPTYKNVVVKVAWSDSTGNHVFTLESNAGW